MLGRTSDEQQLTPDRLFNTDESNLSTVQDGQSKITALRGRKQVGAIASSEWGESVTCVVCMSAAGWFIPPMLIFKRKRTKAELTEGAPPGTVFQSSRMDGCAMRALLIG